MQIRIAHANGLGNRLCQLMAGGTQTCSLCGHRRFTPVVIKTPAQRSGGRTGNMPVFLAARHKRERTFSIRYNPKMKRRS